MLELLTGIWMRNKTAVFLLTALFTAGFGHAQYLSVHAFQMPSFGLMSMDSFEVTPQATLGVGYSHLLTESLWGLVNTSIGYGKIVPDGDKTTRLGTVQGQLGLKYNLLNENWRPFMAGYVQFLHLLGDSIAHSHLRDLSRSWVGLRPSLGLEVFVWDDMSLELEGGYVAYFNLDDPFKHGLQVKIAYNLYF